MRNYLVALILVAVSLSDGIAHAACLPTLGMDDCFRAGDPWVQAIEHHYLDGHRAYSRSKLHPQAKSLKPSPSNPS
jgi:hypothetical protein